LTQYDHIQATRLTDGAKLRAQRVVVDEQTPIRWTIVLVDKLEQYIFDELPMYTTSELIARAKEAGFVDWQQSQVGKMTGLAWIDDDCREVILRQYQIPDRTPYPTD
jgi:hypothetical protein